MGTAPWLIAGRAQRLLLRVETVGRQLEGQVVKLISAGLLRELWRHGHYYDHLGNAGGALACLEEYIGQFGRRDHLQPQQVFVKCDRFLLVSGPQGRFRRFR